MKQILKPVKPYTEDINDMVEGTIEKGGPGSGQKGHQTAQKPRPNTPASHVHVEHHNLQVGSGGVTGKYRTAVITGQGLHHTDTPKHEYHATRETAMARASEHSKKHGVDIHEHENPHGLKDHKVTVHKKS